MATNNPCTYPSLVVPAPILPRIVQLVHPYVLHAARDRNVGEPHLSEHLVGYGQPVCCLWTMVVMEAQDCTYLRPTGCYDGGSLCCCRRNYRSVPNPQ